MSEVLYLIVIEMYMIVEGVTNLCQEKVVGLGMRTEHEGAKSVGHKP